MRHVPRGLALALLFAAISLSPARADVTAIRVVVPFGLYSKGDTLTDPTVIATILTGPNRANVVVVAGTDPGATQPVTVPVGDAGGQSVPTLPPTGLSLLKSFAPNPGRAQLAVQNQSPHTVVLVRDNGNGGGVAVKLLAPGGAQNGAQGAEYSTTTFLGRVQVYGLTSDQVEWDSD